MFQTKQNVFDMIGINESKISTKHISCKCKCKLGRTINVGAIAKIQKNIMCIKKFIFGILVLVLVKCLYWNSLYWNPSTCTCTCTNNTCTSIISDSVITCDQIIDATKTELLNKNYSNKKYFNKFLYFTRLFIKYRSKIDRC